MHLRNSELETGEQGTPDDDAMGQNASKGGFLFGKTCAKHEKMDKECLGEHCRSQFALQHCYKIHQHCSKTVFDLFSHDASFLAENKDLAAVKQRTSQVTVNSEPHHCSIRRKRAPHHCSIRPKRAPHHCSFSHLLLFIVYCVVASMLAGENTYILQPPASQSWRKAYIWTTVSFPVGSPSSASAMAKCGGFCWSIL